jgi:hypothetical protein
MKTFKFALFVYSFIFFVFIGPTPEEMAQLPSRLPEGLGGVGMGLGSGGNPLTEVAKKLPGSTNQSNAGQGDPSGGQGGGYGNTYGLSPQFLENLGIDGPLHTR